MTATACWNSDIDAARAGDVGALERVLRRSRQDLRRFAEYHCPINDVEDAVQDSLFTVSRRLGDLRQVEAFTSWLFRIVKRECNRYKRARNALLQVPITEDIAGPHYPESKGLARDVAMATPANRVAIRGGIDFVNDRFQDMTVAVIGSRIRF